MQFGFNLPLSGPSASPAMLAKYAALALDRKKLAAFSALGGGFLPFPIGDRRCNRTRASVGNAGGNARPSLTDATLAASRLLHRRSPTASPRARPKKVGAFSALGRAVPAARSSVLDGVAGRTPARPAHPDRRRPVPADAVSACFVWLVDAPEDRATVRRAEIPGGRDHRRRDQPMPLS